MASDYRELYTSYWPWALRHGLDDSARCLGAYLLTCDHRTFEGIYRLPAAYAIADLGWDRETYRAALERLVAEGFVLVDEHADVVLLVNALEYRQPKGGPQIAGAVKVLKRLPETPLLRNLLEAARGYAPAFAEAIEEAFPNVLDTPSIPPIGPSNTPSVDTPSIGSSRAQTTSRPLPDPDQTSPSAQAREGAAASLDDARRKLQAEHVRQVFDEWLKATERDPARTKLTDDRKRRIAKALKSHGLDDCLAAVRHIGADKHSEKCARNGYGRGTRFDDIEHALGDTERIERWRDATSAASPSAPKLTNSRDLRRFEGL